MRRLFDAGHPITDLMRKYHVHREGRESDM